MDTALSDLPDDIEALKRLVAAKSEALAAKDVELIAVRAELATQSLTIEKLKVQLARLRRMQFGQSSEKLDAHIHQLELLLEDAEANESLRDARTSPVEPSREERAKQKPFRKPLPDHLPREEIVHAPSCACPSCGGAMRKLGEDVTEVLEYVPASFKSLPRT